MVFDHLGQHTWSIGGAKLAYQRLIKTYECEPPFEVDPRRHLLGPFVSLKKVQKQHELRRLEELKMRQDSLRKLLEEERKQYQAELVMKGCSFVNDVDYF